MRTADTSINTMVQNLNRVVITTMVANFAGEIDTYDFNAAYKVESDSIVYRLRVFLDSYTANKNTETKQDVPLTWVDMFKEKHFPTWLKRIFPVKYRSITVTRHTSFTAMFNNPSLPKNVREGDQKIAYVVSRANAALNIFS